MSLDSRPYMPSGLPDHIHSGYVSSAAISKHVLLIEKRSGRVTGLQAYISRGKSKGRNFGALKQSMAGDGEKFRSLYKASRVFYAAFNDGYYIAHKESYSKDLDDKIKSANKRLRELDKQLAKKEARFQRVKAKNKRRRLSPTSYLATPPVHQSPIGSTLNTELVLGRSRGLNETESGVYFLIEDSLVVYVGKTIDFKGRLKSHIKDPLKSFDRYYLHPCKPENISIIESFYIDMFAPRDNIAPGCTIPAELFA